MNLSLKRSLFSTLIILFLAITSQVAGQDGGTSSIPFSTAPYQVGERLTYIVSYSNFPSAAHVEVQIVSRGDFFGRDAIQLYGHAETTEVINVALFAINNDYTTFIDPTTGLPFRSQLVVHNAMTSTDTFHEFNQAAGTIAIRSKQLTVPGTYDLLSAFYRARALPLSDGASYNFTVRGDNAEEYQVDLRVTGRQVVKTNAGSFNTIATQVRVLNNPRLNNYRIRALFSDDERHVPVLISAKIGDGEIQAELAGSGFVQPPPPAAAPTVTPRPAELPSPVDPHPPEIAPRDENWPFSIGEQLNYQVYLGSSNVVAGVATFQVRGRSRYFGRDGLLLTVKAQTTGAAARIFLANDQINTYVDPKALLPYRTELNLVEGARRKNDILTINQERGTITTSGDKRMEIPVGTHDYLSLFYALRMFTLSPPRSNAVSLLVEDDVKTLVVSSLRREIIELNNQKIPSIALSLTSPDDPESDKYQLRIWVSDDGRRLPLRLTAATELGPIRADLVILPTVAQ